ncbi:adenylyl-sulfate kinase [Aureliella helgolandensis]|uniref:Adenylyl-sulfate kinase n=1 Tax=Aureliella helgolandensis TaxID=2527968 RepID=A0A518G655_9BACT|nr:adenylyl-sulfate kinase [Aureliella helgolandensis]QDV24076.1 Adenylyl-sulfate kinase [Aureliella helgolandensis]
MTDTSPKVVWHAQDVDRSSRERLTGHSGCVVWFTGLSGSGKSTVANALDALLNARGVHTYLLDGDNIRHGLCAGPNLLEAQHGKEFADRFGLGFGPLDREENIRRIGCVAQLLVSAGLITLTAFVSPYRRDRQLVRQWVEDHGQAGDFVEVFVDTPLEVCEARDPKGLYKLARAGKIPNFTGISDPYEAPEQPEIHLQAGERNADQLAAEVLQALVQRGRLPA